MRILFFFKKLVKFSKVFVRYGPPKAKDAGMMSIDTSDTRKKAARRGFSKSFKSSRVGAGGVIWSCGDKGCIGVAPNPWHDKTVLRLLMLTVDFASYIGQIALLLSGIKAKQEAYDAQNVQLAAAADMRATAEAYDRDTLNVRVFGGVAVGVYQRKMCENFVFNMNLSRPSAISKSLCRQVRVPSAIVELFDAVGKPLSYAIPQRFRSEISEGTLVHVPLNNRFTAGVVVRVGNPTYDGQLKYIKNVICHLSPDLAPFARWLCNYYGVGRSSTFGVIVPAEMRKCRKSLPIFIEKTVIKNDPRADALTDVLISDLVSRKFHTVLLREWNFCRRAEIYATLAAKTINLGESVLILAPEILKAEHLAKFLGSHLGIPCLQWHSRLSLKDRTAIWNTLTENNGPFVVIGTPSGIFLPITSPRLIIVDDEEDDSYKCKKMPRFHRRDCAVYRAWLNQALCVLGSGAPSVESIHACNRKKFRYLPSDGPKLREVGNIRVIDIKNSEHNKSLITPALEVEIRTCIQNGKCGILILNRLGYEKCIFCHRCNFELTCPKCGAAIALRRPGKRRFCQVCAYVRPHTRQCPKCHASSLRTKGAGVERVEEILRQIFPEARILCCDHSTISSSKKIGVIRDTTQNDDNIDIVIGTNAAIGLIQAPRVGLVGMLNVDLESRRTDFRAGEHAFQTISRVCHVCAAPFGQMEPIPLILQTRDPNSVILDAIIGGDPNSFYAAELADREVLGYPPHRHLIQQLFFGKSDEEVKCFANGWVELLKKKARTGRSFQLNGPRKLNSHRENERYCLWYFTNSPTYFMGKLREICEIMPRSKEVDYIWDVDARELL